MNRALAVIGRLQPVVLGTLLLLPTMLRAHLDARHGWLSTWWLP